MRTLIILGLIMLSLSGCADSAKIQLGSEAVVYQEIHDFVIEPKNPSDRVEINAQLDRIINSFEPEIEQTLWTLSYRTQLDKSWVNVIKQKLLNLGLVSSRIKVKKLDSGKSVIKMSIGKYRVKTQTCKPSILGRMDSDTGCFVDSMRLKHVRDPRTLILPEGQ
ncbi:hypothetical protein [Shewanella psychrophila]|nr:hypothetical protein [Shewanella psychrophila]